MPVSLLDDPPENRVLWSGGTPTERLTVLERDLATLSDLRLLVLDNVALMFDGEEISRKDVSGFLTALTRMARRLKIGIILIHHASKSQDGTSLRMASGSTAWIAQSRVAAEVRKATEMDGPRLAVRKINNGREWEIDLHWTGEGTLVPIAGVAAAHNRGRLPGLSCGSGPSGAVGQCFKKQHMLCPQTICPHARGPRPAEQGSGKGHGVSVHARHHHGL